MAINVRWLVRENFPKNGFGLRVAAQLVVLTCVEHQIGNAQGTRPATHGSEPREGFVAFFSGPSLFSVHCRSISLSTTAAIICEILILRRRWRRYQRLAIGTNRTRTNIYKFSAIVIIGHHRCMRPDESARAEHFGKIQLRNSGIKQREGFIWFALAAAIILGIALRSIHLTDVSSRSPDERVYTYFAQRIANQGFAPTREIFHQYVNERQLWDYPPPTRITTVVLDAAVMKMSGVRDERAGVFVLGYSVAFR